MKLQCSCGAKYTFEVTPDMAHQPVHFVCSACGLDSSEYVTHLVRQDLPASGPAIAPPPPSLAPPPPSIAPPPPGIASSPRASGQQTLPPPIPAIAPPARPAVAAAQGQSVPPPAPSIAPPPRESTTAPATDSPARPRVRIP